MRLAGNVPRVLGEAMRRCKRLVVDVIDALSGASTSTWCEEESFVLLYDYVDGAEAPLEKKRTGKVASSPLASLCRIRKWGRRDIAVKKLMHSFIFSHTVIPPQPGWQVPQQVASY